MATLTRNTITIDGTDLVNNLGAADAAGDEVDNNVSNNTRTFLVFQNNDASGKQVTVDSQVNCSQGFDHDSAVTIPAGDIIMIGPLPKSRWNEPGTNLVKWTYDDVTSLFVGVFELL